METPKPKSYQLYRFSSKHNKINFFPTYVSYLHGRASWEMFLSKFSYAFLVSFDLIRNDAKLAITLVKKIKDKYSHCVHVLFSTVSTAELSWVQTLFRNNIFEYPNHVLNCA